MNVFFSFAEGFLSDGFMYAVLALGFYISYSILDFPDLSVEGTVLSGAVVYSLAVCRGINPWLALLISFAVGFVAGGITGILHIRFGIRPLLCGILISTALISVNIVTTVVGMGGNFKGEGALTTISFSRNDLTLMRAFPMNKISDNLNGINLRAIILYFSVMLLFKVMLDFYLKTKNGLLLRAVGNNQIFALTLGQNPGKAKITGLALANGYSAVAGALIATARGNANQGMGSGMVVIGLASVIIGLSLFEKIHQIKPTTAVIGGSLVYQSFLSFASFAGLPTVYNKILMAGLFVLALVMGKRRRSND